MFDPFPIGIEEAAAYRAAASKVARPVPDGRSSTELISLDALGLKATTRPQCARDWGALEC
jgi:hypothetical protein